MFPSLIFFSLTLQAAESAKFLPTHPPFELGYATLAQEKSDQVKPEQAKPDPAKPAETPVEYVGHRDAKAYATAWDAVAQRIRNQFYARNQRKAELDQLLKKYEPLAKASHDDEEFSGHIEDMIREFKDSHFDFYTRADLGYYAMDGLIGGDKAAKVPMVGAWFKVTPTGTYVQMVLEGTEADRAKLQRGDKVLSADGKPFEPVLSFADKVGKKVTLQLQRGTEIVDAVVTPSEERPMEAFLQATRDSARTIKVGKKTLAYVHLWTQANDEFRRTLGYMVDGRFANTDGFILDLRDGFGGRPEGFADPFFRPDVSIEWDYSGRKQLTHFGYGRPLVVLINGGSRSAKEILSFILKTSKRATLIGTTTAGNVLGTSPLRINDWSYLELPMVDVRVNGVRLEKKGVDPDIKVPDGLAKDGSDAVIDAAVKFLSKK